MHAVDGISLSVKPGQMLGIVGESGSGKSVSMLTVMGLTGTTNDRDLGFGGRSRVATCLQLPNEELRKIRGNDIAMIFQDPLSSLHPFYRVGDAARRGDPDASGHAEVGGQETRRRAARSWSGSRPAAPRRPATRTSSPAACGSAR